MMKIVKLFILLIALSAMFFIKNGNTATITANSCSQTVVQAAINSASAGDTVTIPAGTCTWTSQVTITKGITLKGAGIDQTKITGNGNKLISMSVAGNQTWRITGMTISGGGEGTLTIEQTGLCTNFRIDNVKFTGINGRAIIILTNITGVIDSCQFINNEGQTILIQPQNSTMTQLWTTPTSNGGVDAVYIENNIFKKAGDYGTFIDSVFGGKYVCRYNTITNGIVLDHGWEMQRSGLKMEVYNNTFTANVSFSVTMPVVSIRGGTGLVYNNTITGNPLTNYWEAIVVSDYATCYGVGAPPASFSGSGKGRCMTYPCPDQVGRTYNQLLAPVYQWNNTYNGQAVTVHINDMGCTNPSIYDHIQKDRDYYDNVKMPGYTPYQYPHPLRVPGALPKAPSLFIVPKP